MYIPDTSGDKMPLHYFANLRRVQISSNRNYLFNINTHYHYVSNLKMINGMQSLKVRDKHDDELKDW